MTIPFYQTHSDTNAPNYVDYCRSKYWTSVFQGAYAGGQGIPNMGGGPDFMVQTDPYWPIEVNECDYVAHIPTIGGKSSCNYTTCTAACDLPRLAVDQFGPAATLGYGAIRRPCRTIYDRCNCLVTGLPASSYASWHTPCRMVLERNGLSCQALCPRIGGCHNPGLTSSGQNYQGFVSFNCNCIHSCRSGDYAANFDRAMSFGSVLPVGEYMINMAICQPVCTNCKHCIYFAYTRTNMTREDWIDKDCCCAGWGCADPNAGSHNMTYCCLSFCTNGGTQMPICMCCRGRNQYNVLASCVCANPSQFWISATSGTQIAYCSSCNCHCWTAFRTGSDCAARNAVDHIIGFFCVNPDCVNSSYPCLCEVHTLKRSVGCHAGMFYHLEVNNAPTGKIFTKSVVTDGGPCMPACMYRGFYIIDRANCIACVMSPMWGNSSCCPGCSLQGDFIYTSRGTWVGLMSKHRCQCDVLNNVCNYPILVEFNSSWSPLAAVAMVMCAAPGVVQSVQSCFGTYKLAYDPYDDAIIGSVSVGGVVTSCNSNYECTLKTTGNNIVFRLPSCIRCICCAVSYRGCESGPVCCLYYCCCSCNGCLWIGRDYTNQCIGTQFYWQKLSASCVSMYHRGCINTCGVSPNSSNPMCGICNLYSFADCIFSQACGCYNGSKCLCTNSQFDSACCRCFRRFEYPLGSAITRCGLLHGCTENPAACYVGVQRSACLVYHCMNGS